MPRKHYYFSSAIKDKKFKHHPEMILPVLLGKNRKGAFMVDLAKMPHLLIGGRKDSGKTNFLHGLILSLLCQKSPEQLKFVLINQKLQEYNDYNDTPYLLTPVISSTEKAIDSLLWCYNEMYRRYSLLSHAKVRNIGIYNETVGEEHKLPYIVIIIDEFSDIVTSEYSENFKEYVIRICQKASAVGIHLIMATNKINEEMILPIFKANIPSRIAFSTRSDIESQIILDQNGAEHLAEVGNILLGGCWELTNIQTAFTTNKMIAKVISQVNIETNISYIDLPKAEMILPKIIEKDELVSEALAYFVSGNPISILCLQRKFDIGFNRAANIIDWLENEGFISKLINDKRKILKTELNEAKSH